MRCGVLGIDLGDDILTSNGYLPPKEPGGDDCEFWTSFRQCREPDLSQKSHEDEPLYIERKSGQAHREGKAGRTGPANLRINAASALRATAKSCLAEMGELCNTGVVEKFAVLHSATPAQAVWLEKRQERDPIKPPRTTTKGVNEPVVQGREQRA
ncbi:hypothetical protein DFH06DRAFT_1130898 [Mycena polygramma]|nr:hypothetical protein DFH06DRAFT_1130898 [Mycena polygramma]